MQPDLLAKRIRENLVSQKEKLEEYLNVLDTTNGSITDKDTKKILAAVNIEKDVIAELESFKTILEPLEIMYEKSPYKKDGSLSHLKETIQKLSSKVVIKAEVNQQALNSALEEVTSKIDKVKSKNNFLKNTYTGNRSMAVDFSL